MLFENLTETKSVDACLIHDHAGNVTYKILQKGLSIEGVAMPNLYLVTSSSGVYEAIDPAKLHPSKRFYRNRNAKDVIEAFILVDITNEKQRISLSSELCDLINTDAGMRDHVCFIDATCSEIDIAKDDNETSVYCDDKFTIIDGQDYGYDEYLILLNSKIITV